MQVPLIYIGLAAAAGIGIGVMLAGDPVTTESRQPVAGETRAVPGIAAERGDTGLRAASAEVADLRRSLRAEIRAREALEQKLEVLTRRVAALDTAANAGPGPFPAQDETAADSDASATGWFDEQALIKTGMDSVRANQLKQFFEQLEMERLYLRDQSAREGWERARLREEMLALDDKEESLREQLGESAYEAYLYASGQPNRVAVTSVLASAQAGQAGILAGDHILRYDSQRIYNWRDLREATTGGNISDTVEVQVERDGETIQFYLARGPMGIRMDSLSVAP